ncbi:DoxX family membrane protein [Cellulomonas sp. IC4_254]|uniref:DoxX family membrane protein n=1 Tax=Cellulomonas sp. IC4_254 TaxID=2714040 RepID=UPI00141EE079|nr:DoxX family membrane protein [Cellulomonas sp. IC4_254]
MKLRHLPLRLGAGAYILNSGLDKLGADEETAKGLHGTAAGAYPFLSGVDPKTFTTALGATEVSLGTALLVPVLPRVAVATGFTAFSAALVGLYLRTPALHRGEGDPRPNPDGVGIAKDVVILGAAASYLIDTLTSSAKKAGTKAAKKAAKAVHR